MRERESRSLALVILDFPRWQQRFVQHADEAMLDERIRLRELGPEEKWLQEEIEEGPSLPGLGDLFVIQRERKQSSDGRIDLPLHDPEAGLMYETEIVLAGRLGIGKTIRLGGGCRLATGTVGEWPSACQGDWASGSLKRFPKENTLESINQAGRSEEAARSS
jgi:hypothetical protein